MQNLFLVVFVLIIIFILFWSYSGYIIFLFLISRAKKPKVTQVSFNPSVSIIVPCFNEEALIQKKVQNVLSLDNPSKKTEIIFIDGGSTDQTVSLLKKTVKNHANLKILKTNPPGKIPQLNYALSRVKGEIIVITDVDAVMAKNTITKILKEFKNKDTGVVGSQVIPSASIPIEKQYWQTQNKIRLLESKAHCSSIVIGVCYAFRKKVLDKFPRDVIADDIYMAFKANFSGYRSIYLKDPKTLEVRTPKSFSEWFYHKTRKGHAFIKEILRFLPMIGKGHILWQIIYLTKCLQLLVVPSLLLVTLLLFIMASPLKLIIYFSLVMCLSLFAGNRILSKVKTGQNRNDNLPLIILTFLISNLIIFIQFWTYPFSKQTSSYAKIAQNNA